MWSVLLHFDDDEPSTDEFDTAAFAAEDAAPLRASSRSSKHDANKGRHVQKRGREEGLQGEEMRRGDEQERFPPSMGVLKAPWIINGLSRPRAPVSPCVAPPLPPFPARRPSPSLAPYLPLRFHLIPSLQSQLPSHLHPLSLRDRAFIFPFVGFSPSDLLQSIVTPRHPASLSHSTSFPLCVRSSVTFLMDLGLNAD